MSHSYRRLNLSSGTGLIAMTGSAATTTLKSALQETEEIIFSVVEGLLNKTGITAQEVTLSSAIVSLSKLPLSLPFWHNEPSQILASEL